MSEQLQKSRLITLSNGQIVGHPITRRALKRAEARATQNREAQRKR